VKRQRPTTLVDDALARIVQREQIDSEKTAALRLLSAHGKLHSRYQGEAFWQAGEQATHFLVILNGCVEVTAPGKSDQRNVLGIIGPGDIAGLPAVLGRTVYPATTTAISFRVDALRVPLSAARERDATVARALLQAMVLHEQVLRAKIAILTAGTIERRLAILMRYLDERFGDGTRDKRTLRVDLSRVQIAALVGARSETIIRLLSKWRKAGWLADQAIGFVLDRRRIDQILSQA